ncbi:uroporphyrinogen-III synthase [Brevundimonas sp.]|uniref:uroporphyrinogen-III synthase n=1 Tax=Brevundimonas sp. TaxID=1871086 RepID=UPI0022BEF8AC|nr:uroporphyrinogen-III synthase [Brevundimonas sp.]MCZ8195102.1 uroporphyrinogen-III synthase [Brevundimonas sp.]
MAGPGRIWLTRSRPGAEADAAALAALGHAPLIDPVLEIVPVPVTVDLEPVAAVAVTSAAAVRALAALTPRRDRPLFAVGAATAAAARAAGFEEVDAGDEADGDGGGGDAAALAARLVRAAPPDRSPWPVLWPRGREVAADLAALAFALAPGRVEIRPVVVYAAEPRRPDAALAAVAAGQVAAVLLHSPRGARAAAAALQAAGLPPPPAIALSPAVAAAWPGPVLAVAARPDAAALRDALGRAHADALGKPRPRV